MCGATFRNRIKQPLFRDVQPVTRSVTYRCTVGTKLQERHVEGQSQTLSIAPRQFIIFRDATPRYQRSPLYGSAWKADLPTTSPAKKGGREAIETSRSDVVSGASATESITEDITVDILHGPGPREVRREDEASLADRPDSSPHVSHHQ